MKQLLAGLFIFSYCLSFNNAETVSETDALPIDNDFSVSLNPIDTSPPQQLSQRLLPVGLFLVPKVIALGQQVGNLQGSVAAANAAAAAAAAAANAALASINNRFNAIANGAASLCPPGGTYTITFSAMANPPTTVITCPSSRLT